MKVKVVLTKGYKNTKFTRTLNIDNRAHSKTAESSLKDLTLPSNANNKNNIVTSKNNLIKTKINNTEKSNSKIKKNNHIILKAKDKENNLKNNTISNISNVNKYKKLNILEEKKKNYIKKEKSFTNYNIKKYKYEKDKDKKMYYKTPMRIRKTKSGKSCIKEKITVDSRINKQYLNSLYYNDMNMIDKNNNNNIILNLKKELELLKKENIYKTMLINNMKQQIEEYRKQQEIIKENKLLKEEIILLKNNNTNNINDFKNKDKDIDLFDKLKRAYFNNQIKLNELKKENDILKNNLNLNRNNFLVEKNIDIIYNDKLNRKNIKNNINNYIENKYKLILQKENNDINNYYKPLKEEQKKEINFLIKMTLLSNHISKDKILNLLLNNLINFNYIINIIISDCLKTNSTYDKVLLKHYFTNICLISKKDSVVFDINNFFNEINNYYNDIEDITSNYTSQKIFKFLSGNENIKQLINECKFKDQFNVGIIEYNDFNDIFIGAYGNYINNKNKNNKELYDLLIYVMKNYYNLDELGLYHLNYQNLSCNSYQQRLKSIKSVNNKDNDNLGNNDEMQDIFNKKYYSNNNSCSNNSNSENSSALSNKYKNKRKISNEDVVANVSINVDHSTAVVNVKFKNHYDSDYDNNSVVQTSINGINSGKSRKNNEISSLENKNEDKENILLNNEICQICLDFVANIFEYCLDKLHRDETNVNKIHEDI